MSSDPVTPSSPEESDELDLQRRSVNLKRVNILLGVMLVMIALSLGMLWGKVYEVQFASSRADTLSAPVAFHAPDTLSTTTFKDRLRWGDNLASVLSRNLTDPEEIDAILPILSHLTDLRRLPVGTRLTMERDELGLRSLVVNEPKRIERYHLDRTGRLLYVARVDTVPIDTLQIRYHGVVQNSFYNSFLEAGGTPELAVKFIEVFQFVYYFSSETRKGDQYSLIAEELWQEGKRIGYDDVLAAEYLSNGDTLTAVWLPMEGNEFGGEHFDGQGRSLRRALLRVPFSAARVTSTYGVRRHPITGKIRFHHGVDLAAHMGTPVVASGSGTITIVGRNDPGYGNWIHIRHGRTGFETRYGHMRAFAKGIHRGMHVRQGQVIGYVGMTGHATGPHLHYEVFRDGRRLNPLKTKASPVKQLKGDKLTHFLNDYHRPWKLRLNNRGVLPGPQWYGPQPAIVEQTLGRGAHRPATETHVAPPEENSR